MPTRSQRIVVAGAITLLVCVRFYFTHAAGNINSDFTPIRFASGALLHGGNPYDLIGPGRAFASRLPILYPATAFVFAIPFTIVTEPLASLLFVAISAFLLVYGATRDSWHRLPMFASIAFITSAQLAQFSLLATTAVFIPCLGFIAAIKPQAGIPVVVSSTSRGAIISAVSGALVLGAVSLALFPRWPVAWIGQLQSTGQVSAPVTRLGGFVILAVLLRWKRSESWLVALMAVLPQTWYGYNALPLLTTGKNFREVGLLAVVSSAGSLATALMTGDLYSAETMRVGGAMLVATAYLPAVVLILRRPNERPSPAWLKG